MLRELFPQIAVLLISVVVLGAAIYFFLVPAAVEPRLSLPIDCRLGETCFVQNYVDIDPGSGAQDFACGSATYDGHKGTDFRVLSAAIGGVAVLAVADGKVLRGRDSMPDRLLRDYGSKSELRSIVGRNQCGNGLVVDHGDGWTTQYCHLKRGSIVVRPGQEVVSGERLGTVGYSGTADFAHVHLTVRHNEKVVDPFLGADPSTRTCDPTGPSHSGLWRDELRDGLSYGKHVIIDAGFTNAAPDNDALERDHRMAKPEQISPALVFYARMINLRKGDRISVSVAGPQGFKVKNTTKPLDRNKATQMIFAGKKLRAENWPMGTYRGGVSVLRRASQGGAEKVVAKRRVDFELK